MERAIFAAVMVYAGIGMGFAQPFIPPSSNRVVINLGDTPWKFIRQDVVGAQNPSYNDSHWQTVGIPHCYNDFDSFQNVESGIQSTYQGTVWYRKHIQIPTSFNEKKIFLHFEQVSVACALYVNGMFIPGNSKVVHPSPVTHVGGYIPFVVDITTYVVFGDNVIALKVGNLGYWNSGYWYTPTLGEMYWVGGQYGGILAPVRMVVTDLIYVPLNVYSVLEQWGTYVAVTNVTDASANIRMQTNVRNESNQPQQIQLRTDIVDASGTVVLTMISTRTVQAGATALFDQTGTILNPHLWYPNYSPYGAPYLYTVYSTVLRDGVQPIDVCRTPLGVRTITWDNNFPYINGRKHLMRGAAKRYDYPGFGSGLPEEVRWKDIRLLKDCGGNFLRPSHQADSVAVIEACDAYGVCVTQANADCEGQVTPEHPEFYEYKREFLRDIIVRDRNNPSIIAWELSNGSLPLGFAAELKNIVDAWDSLNRTPSNRRAVAGTNRPHTIDWSVVDIGGVMNDEGASTKRQHPMTPVYTSEMWYSGRGYTGRASWRTEPAEGYINIISNDTLANCFGVHHFSLFECSGEACYETPLEGGRVRGQGWSMTDGNRLPKIVYHAYQKGMWIPFDQQPGVFIGGHWNYASGSTVTVKVWSNCPSVELFLNNVSQGVKIPNPITQFPQFQCSWNLTFISGTLRAVGRNALGTPVCFDEWRTAGAPYRIQLEVEPSLIRPDGKAFATRANGSDATFILARVVDVNGYLCPTASNTITFAVSGPGTYLGSYNFKVYEGRPLGYHAPGDPELDAEAGMIKIAVRSTFLPGEVTVTATSPGLIPGATSFTVYGISAAEGTPAKLSCVAEATRLLADNASSTTVRALVSDVSGHLVVTASTTVTFFLSGPGTLVGPNPVATHGGVANITYRAGESSGSATIFATAVGLATGSVAIQLIRDNPPRAIALRCENMDNPIGITNNTPELSWVFSDDVGDTQFAYQLLVATSPQGVLTASGTIWDTGKVLGNSNYEHYRGPQLQPFTTYYWGVIVWDSFNIPSTFTALAFFVMGGNRAPYAPTNLLVDGVHNQTMLSNLHPVLSWTFSDPDIHDRQNAFRIIITDDLTYMSHNIGNVWDTGMVLSSETHIVYAGRPLQYNTEYYWKVMVWDINGATSPYSGVNVFSTMPPPLDRDYALRFIEGSMVVLGNTTYYDIHRGNASGMTVEFWIMPNTVSNGAIIGRYEWDVGGYKVFLWENEIRVWEFPEGEFESSVKLVPNAWNHVAVQFGVPERLFINGVLRQVTSTNTAMPGSCNAILFVGGLDNDFFNGVIDEVRISNVVRYTTDFVPSTASYVADGNTIGLWHFDEGIGTTVWNIAGSSAISSGSIMGAQWIVAGEKPVIRPPEVRINTPAFGSTVFVNDPIPIHASVASGVGLVQSVNFYVGSSLLGTDSSSPYEFTWVPSSPGMYRVTATAVNTYGFSAVSLPVDVVVISSASQVPPGSVQVRAGGNGYCNLGKREVVSIMCTPVQTGILSVKIYTLSGRLVWENHGIIEDISRTTNINWIPEDIPSGVYLIVVRGAGVNARQKIVVVR